MIETGSLHKHHTILYNSSVILLFSYGISRGHHKSFCKLENATLTVVLVG